MRTKWPSGANRSTCPAHHPRSLLCLVDLFIICLVILPVVCQASQSSMELGATLLSNQTLLSPAGLFELGFYSAMRSDVATPVYTLAIWYARVPAKTVVWFPDRSLALGENASLSLSPQGDLEVYDNIGSPQLMWTSNTMEVSHPSQTRPLAEEGKGSGCRVMILVVGLEVIR